MTVFVILLTLPAASYRQWVTWRKDLILEDSSGKDSGSEGAISQTSSAQVKQHNIAIDHCSFSLAKVMD